jgi:hypothetical protein
VNSPAAQVSTVLVDERASLQKLLSRPISCLLPSEDSDAAARIAEACRGQNLILESLGQLLTAENPPVELLVMARDFAKRHLASENSSLPRRATRVLYLAAICAARIRCGKVISLLPTAELASQIDWARHLPAVPDNLRATFEHAYTILAAGQFEPEPGEDRSGSV